MKVYIAVKLTYESTVILGVYRDVKDADARADSEMTVIIKRWEAMRERNPGHFSEEPNNWVDVWDVEVL